MTVNYLRRMAYEYYNKDSRRGIKSLMEFIDYVETCQEKKSKSHRERVRQSV